MQDQHKPTGQAVPWEHFTLSAESLAIIARWREAAANLPEVTEETQWSRETGQSLTGDDLPKQRQGESLSEYRERVWGSKADPLHGEQCDTCGDLVTDLYPGTTVVNFERHNREAYVRHLEITGELHVLNCIACGQRTNPDVDDFVPGIGSLHATCDQPCERCELNDVGPHPAGEPACTPLTPLERQYLGAMRERQQ